MYIGIENKLPRFLPTCLLLDNVSVQMGVIYNLVMNNITHFNWCYEKVNNDFLESANELDKIITIIIGFLKASLLCF